MKTRHFATLASILAILLVAALAVGLSGVWQADRATAQPNGQVAPNEPASPPGPQQKQVPVVLTPAKSMTFEPRIVVSGSVLAKRYALVSARIPGTLDAVFVDEGDPVQSGQTKLFQTDSLKLTKAVAIAQHSLTVAECTVQEKQAMAERNLAALDQARKDLDRYRDLLARNAIAAQVVEQQEAQHRQAAADVRHTESLVNLARAQLEQTRLNLTIAQKDLADSLVLAPITGMVAERMREPGEMAAPGTPVLRIEDLSLLEVSVFLPEQYYAQVVPGKTIMRVRVGQADLGTRPIDYKSPTVHTRLRTFEVKGLVQSPPPGVVPGCLAEVAIITDSRKGVGVPAGAIQTRGGRSVVFTVRSGTAKMLAVTPGVEIDGWREIVEGVSPGTPLISMGQFLVEQGTPVSTVREEPAP